MSDLKNSGNGAQSLQESESWSPISKNLWKKYVSDFRKNVKKMSDLKYGGRRQSQKNGGNVGNGC